MNIKTFEHITVLIAGLSLTGRWIIGIDNISEACACSGRASVVLRASGGCSFYIFRGGATAYFARHIVGMELCAFNEDIFIFHLTIYIYFLRKDHDV